MNKLIFLEPIFKERIWGGRRLEEQFKYKLPDGQIGECWAISGHKNGSSIVKNGIYKGMTLAELYSKHKKELFSNDSSPVFPILVKILDAHDDLSVQVHPDDDYALKNCDDLGKTECWYIIDSDNESKIIHGHTAKTKDEFIKKVKNNDLSLWKYQTVKKNDFIYVPATTVHAIGKGTLIYEVQQSSDTTYRIYDYDRKDSNGMMRDLHLDKALEVIHFPDSTDDLFIQKVETQSNTLYHYIKNQYFSVSRVEIREKFELKKTGYVLISIISGDGKIMGEDVQSGDHLIITSNVDEFIIFEGNMNLIYTTR